MQSRMETSENFEAEVFVTTRLDRELALMCQDYAIKAITKCSELYNFDLTEALQKLNLTNTKIEREQRKEKEGKVVKIDKIPKFTYPLPFNGQHNTHNCSALRLNHGLYTQCCNLLPKKESSLFCKTCTTSANKNNDKIHEYGTIQERMEQSIESYVDPLGRTPTHYLKVLKKIKISMETVIAETSSYNITINPFHLTPPQHEHNTKIGNPKSPKGRPKKEEKLIEILDDTNTNNIDLFKNLVKNRDDDDDDYDNEDADTESNHSTNTTIMLTLELPLNDESINNTDVEILPAAETIVEYIPPSILNNKNKKQREKEEKEALRQKEKEEKAEKEALRQKEKEEKEALRQKEKEEKALRQKEKEENKKVSKKTKKTKEVVEEVVVVPVVAEEEEEEALPVVVVPVVAEEEEALPVVVEEVVVEEVVVVPVVAQDEDDEEEEEEEEVEEECKRIIFNGKYYLHSVKSNIVYDYEKYTKTGDQIVIGKLNIKTNLIEFKTKNDDDEEEEEEYDD